MSTEQPSVAAEYSWGAWEKIGICRGFVEVRITMARFKRFSISIILHLTNKFVHERIHVHSNDCLMSIMVYAKTYHDKFLKKELFPGPLERSSTVV